MENAIGFLVLIVLGVIAITVVGSIIVALLPILIPLAVVFGILAIVGKIGGPV